MLHELDVLVLATGFKADAFMRPMRSPAATADARRGMERPEAYLSVSIPDFPNFFMLNGPNGPVGNFSLIEVAELQFALRHAARRALRPANAARSAPRAGRWS